MNGSPAQPTPSTPPTDCGRGNCKILNPLRPDLWCRECLVEEIQQLKRGLRTGNREGQFTAR